MTAKATFQLPHVFDIGPVSKQAVREAVSLCRAYWPNALLGYIPPREDIASAFRTIRRRVASGETLFQAASYLQHDAYRHADM